MTDGHYPSYREMLDRVQWERYGVVDGVARDPRCENCMVHCGYDPSGALGTNYQSGDNWKNFKYNFSPRPPVCAEGATVQAFNGCSIGKGHLAEARATLRPNSGQQPAPTGSCGSGGTTQRDELLARIRAADKDKTPIPTR
jgi:hypothetical protein